MTPEAPARLGPVAVVACSSYDEPTVLAAVSRAVDLLGGISSFVKPGERVLLKPNLLADADPDTAIATHPTVAAAVSTLLKRAGATGLVADTPGANVPFTRAGLTRLYRATGYESAADAGRLNLNWDTDSVSLAHAEGRLVKRFEVMRPVAEADAVIALPKLKTHVLMTLTGATKILFGVIPGLAKVGLHANLIDPGHFADMLLDLCALVHPRLYVLDAVLAMEGNGPGRHGRPRKLDAIIAGTDPVAIDLVACELLGVDPNRVPTLVAARARGLWSGAPHAVTVLGTPLDSIRVRDFALPASVADPQGGRRLMMPLHRVARPLVAGLLTTRPAPNPERCTGCGACVRACPVGAIHVRQRLAVVDDALCVRCYCCHELCAQAAVDLRPARARALLRWLGLDAAPAAWR